MEDFDSTLFVVFKLKFTVNRPVTQLRPVIFMPCYFSGFLKACQRGVAVIQ